MKYSEADTVVSKLIRTLVDAHLTKYPTDSESYAHSYALGYISSMLASIMCQSEDAVQAVTVRLVTSERYLQSLK
jgi:hypothetical protein